MVGLCGNLLVLRGEGLRWCKMGWKALRWGRDHLKNR